MDYASRIIVAIVRSWTRDVSIETVSRDERILNDCENEETWNGYGRSCSNVILLMGAR